MKKVSTQAIRFAHKPFAAAFFMLAATASMYIFCFLFIVQNTGAP